MQTIEAARAPQPTVAHVFGEMTWLLTQSQEHRTLPLSALEPRIMPPILLQQFKIFYDGTRPIGYAVWAHLSDEFNRSMSEQSGTDPILEMRLVDWKSGPHRWLIDVVCPFDNRANNQRRVIFDKIINSIFNNGSYHIHRFNCRDIDSHETSRQHTGSMIFK